MGNFFLLIILTLFLFFFLVLIFRGALFFPCARTEIYDKPNDNACRQNRKNAAKPEREMYTAVCAACGKEATVPFKPREDRPVYCSECFARMREER